jgi:hypothetical protein
VLAGLATHERAKRGRPGLPCGEGRPGVRRRQRRERQTDLGQQAQPQADTKQSRDQANTPG